MVVSYTKESHQNLVSISLFDLHLPLCYILVGLSETQEYVKAKNIFYQPSGPWSRRLLPISVMLSGRESLISPLRDTNQSQGELHKQ